MTMHWSHGVLVAALLSLPAAPATAKRIYQYVDEKGVVHFTDRKPDTEQPVSEKLVRVDGQQLVSLRESGAPENLSLTIVNQIAGPVEVELRFAEGSENVTSDPPFPRRVVVPPRGEVLGGTVRPASRNMGARYRVAYEYVPGDPHAAHAPSTVYYPPFAPEGRFFVGQAFGGSFSHNEDYSQHCIDLSLPPGTPVHVARDGVVMQVEDDFYGRGLDREKFGGRANHVRVLHEDGSMAIYAHLELESVLASPGSKVRTGDFIGNSGDTGFTTGPHLHFCVQVNAGLKVVTVPFRMAGRNGAYDPREGMWMEGYAAPR